MILLWNISLVIADFDISINMNTVWDIEISSKTLNKTYVNIGGDLIWDDRDTKIGNIPIRIWPIFAKQIRVPSTNYISLHSEFWKYNWTHFSEMFIGHATRMPYVGMTKSSVIIKRLWNFA